ncbi:MAG TPA: hypothetical protein VIL92_06255 [Gaiellaceae bacterium]
MNGAEHESATMVRQRRICWDIDDLDPANRDLIEVQSHHLSACHIRPEYDVVLPADAVAVNQQVADLDVLERVVISGAVEVEEPRTPRRQLHRHAVATNHKLASNPLRQRWDGTPREHMAVVAELNGCARARSGR